MPRFTAGDFTTPVTMFYIPPSPDLSAAPPLPFLLGYKPFLHLSSLLLVIDHSAAARALGISLNKLKRACRQYGIPRWPYRQVRSIRSTIQSLKNALEKCESEIERASLKDRLDSLIKKESLVCKFASCGEKERQEWRMVSCVACQKLRVFCCKPFRQVR